MDATAQDHLTWLPRGSAANAQQKEEDKMKKSKIKSQVRDGLEGISLFAGYTSSFRWIRLSTLGEILQLMGSVVAKVLWLN